MNNGGEIDMRGLIARAREGDAAALNSLCLALNEQVLKKMKISLHGSDDYREVAQEVILWFLRHFEEDIHDENIPALLASKAFYMLKSHFRTKYARKEIALESIADLADGEAETSLEETLDRNELRKRLMDGLGALPQNFCDVITRRYFQEMSFKEIAAELGLTEANVRQRHKRGRELLKTKLKT